MDFLVKTCTKRSKHHHRNLHIRNSLGTKFQLEMTILNFWTKLTQNGLFRIKKIRKIKLT